MKLHTLKPAEGSIKNNKRIGRGQGSGRGGTSTKGHNGAQSRSGYSRKEGFEGGQMPLQRRVPKFGFKSPNRVETKLKEITMETLIENGVAGKKDIVKVLGRGELTATVDITVHHFSKSAVEAIESKGGKATAL